MATMLQRWEKDTRYYLVSLEKVLLDTWVITRVWGRRGTPRGQIRLEAVDSEKQGLQRIVAICRTRQQHGYKTSPHEQALGRHNL